MKYCIECGAKLIEKECINFGQSEGIVPYCPSCGEFRFPVYNTAVSMVIFNCDYSKSLLIQQYGRKKNILVAGYVNKCESLEQALVREIREEINLDILDYKFNASEYFEKSNTLICNFIVRSKNENFALSQEVDYAEWYSLKEAKRVILKDSLAEKFFDKAVEKGIAKNYLLSA